MTFTRPARLQGFIVLLLRICFLNTLILTNLVHGQTGKALPLGSDTPLNGPDSPVSLRFAVETNSRFGILTYVPEQWGDLQLRVENSSEVDRNLLCTSYFGQQSTLQFGRQIWIPARSRLSVSHPVLLPPVDQLKDEVAEIRSLIIDNSSGQEVLLKSDGGELLHERSLLVSSTTRNSGVIAGWRSEDMVPTEVMDLIIAGRVNQGLNNKISVLSGQFLPTDEASLNYLDHIVVMENRLLDDLAAMTALRRWLHAGGSLWIMLDRTDPLLVEQLLGDDHVCHLIDRVSLTSVRIDETPSLLNPSGTPGDAVDFDEPVEMARVAISGMTVQNSVEGWPAALTGMFGEGRVLITTLGARGWIRPAPVPPIAVADTNRLLKKETRFVPVSPMEDLAAFVLGQRAPSPLSQESLQSLTQEYISYRIPSWSLIIGIMSVFLVLLTAIAVWLWRKENLEHFGWIGSATSVVIGLLLTGIGLVNRYGVPETLASVQFAQAFSGTDDVRTAGVIGVYRREGAAAPIETTQGGRLWPDMTGLEGSTRRLVTSDIHQLHWAGLPQPSGLRMYPDTTSRSLPNRIAVEATLNSEGLVGRFTGQSEGLSDTIIATRNGRVAVTLESDGHFTAASKDVMEPGQFLNAAFLGDVQDRRQRILKQLFENSNWRESLIQPHLLVWLKDWDHGFRLGDDLQQQGETLMSIPIRLSRPPVGTEMVIPSPLISYVGCLAPDGSLPTGFWDDNRKEWQERSGPSLTWLSFQIPQSLLPLKATKANVVVKVFGDMGQLEILGVKDGTEVTIQTVNNPAGSLVFELNDPTVLDVSVSGALRLGVKAGIVPETPSEPSVDLMSGSTASYWRIESLALQLSAVTTDQSAEE